MIKLLKKDIVELEISPLGGIIHIDKCQNDFNYKELLIYISGPFASFILYLFLSHLSFNEILINSSFYVLVLNLLPILPLDGGKVITTILNYLLPHRKVLKIVTTLSLFTSILLTIYFINNINYVVIMLFFVYLNLNGFYEIRYQYYDFLCYKYFHRNNYLHNKLIVSNDNAYSLFYKGFNNVFFRNNAFLSEENVLERLISKK